MKLTPIRAAAVAAICLCAVPMAFLVGAAPAPNPGSNGTKWLPVENSDIYGELGAQVWRLSIPASQLKKMKRVSVGVRAGPAPWTALVGLPIPDRYQVDAPEDPWIVNVTIVRDNAFWDEAKRMKFALSSPNGQKFQSRSATYVPSAAKRMSEPGTYFREADLGEKLLDEDGVVLFGVFDLDDSNKRYIYYIRLD